MLLGTILLYYKYKTLSIDLTFILTQNIVQLNIKNGKEKPLYITMD